MEVDGLKWMDWLHKTRRESKQGRKRIGLSRIEWLVRIEREAEQIRAGLSQRSQPVARDKPKSGD